MIMQGWLLIEVVEVEVEAWVLEEEEVRKSTILQLGVE